MAEFTHLHLHTQYSLLDGAIRVDDLFPKVLRARDEDAWPSPTTATCSARSTSTSKAKKHGVKPIFGCETYVAARSPRQDRTAQLPPDPAGQERRRLEEPVVPELDGVPRGLLLQPAHRQEAPARAQPRAWSACSACLGGEIAQTLTRRGHRRPPRRSAREYDDIFGARQLLPRDDAQRPARAGRRSTSELIELSQEDRHPARRHQRLPLPEPAATPRAHEILMASSRRARSRTRSGCSTDRRLLHEVAGGDERAASSTGREAMENAARIGELCNVELELGKNTYLPQVQGARGRRRSRRYVAELAAAGAATRASRSSPRAASKFDADVVRERAASSSWASSRRWSSPATSSSSGTSSTTPRSTASRSARAAARAPARWSRMRCASPTSIRSRTSCCSSAS